MAKILITSALPYINGVKHLGNLAGSLLPADVHARFRRQIGDEVLFICATDEHGTPAELGAIEAGQDVRAYCDAQHAIQADVYRRFGFTFDHFGRTSSPQNHALTQHFYRRLDAAGLIDERSVWQVWSAHDRRFLPDRYVRGTCPHCGSDAARGDHAAPWTVFASNPANAAATTRVALNLVRLSAVLSWSIIPQIAGRVLAAFGDRNDVPPWPEHVEDDILRGCAGRAIAPLDLPVSKISEEHAARLQARFGG